MAVGPGPQQVFQSNIVNIRFPPKGAWCSVQVFLGNEGEGGNASLTITGLGPDLDNSFTVVLGTDGLYNGTFFDAFSPIPGSVTYKTSPDEFEFEGFGVGNFQGGDNHNGSAFYFKLKEKEFDVAFTSNGSVHSPSSALIWDKEDPMFPYDFFAPHDILSEAHSMTIGPENYHFNTTADEEEVTIV